MRLHSVLRRWQNSAFAPGSLLLVLLFLGGVLLLSGCSDTTKTGALPDAHVKGRMDLQYATQFRVTYYDDDISVIEVEDGLKYILAPDPENLPEWLTEADLGEYTVIGKEADSVYMAASSGMDLISAVGGLDAVSMTSTAASDWADPVVRALVEEDRIRYVGKYRAPDFEALVEEDVDLAVESTMIYHDPDVKEAIEALGIPVLVERSSYETDPLGRLEWIRLYGLLLGKQEEADAFFDASVGKIESVDVSEIETIPSVAFFAVNAAGAVIVRKPGDYITKMIETAGGEYALDGLAVEEENALSTMNMQMEAFYDMAADADILIYNSTIEEDLEKKDDLIALSDSFSDFRAVKNDDVWCTNRNVFQKVTGAADMIAEMNRIFAGAETDEGFEYFHKLY